MINKGAGFARIVRAVGAVKHCIAGLARAAQFDRIRGAWIGAVQAGDTRTWTFTKSRI